MQAIIAWEEEFETNLIPWENMAIGNAKETLQGIIDRMLNNHLKNDRREKQAKVLQAPCPFPTHGSLP